jgi:tetratricopeptide (TPR) repeat protein
VVGKAFFERSSAGDIGSEIRYLQFIGAGLNEVNRQSEALYLFDRAIELARDTPGVGFPYMAYEVKTQALTTLGKSAQARALLEDTLAQGRAAHRLDTEAQVQTLLGEIELKLGDERKGVRNLEAAGILAQRYGFHRITAEAMFDLYGAYRQAGDLKPRRAVRERRARCECSDRRPLLPPETLMPWRSWRRSRDGRRKRKHRTGVLKRSWKGC